ncbi:hypothetical protein Tco_0529335 [Tanacetum coccineum]
MPVYLSSLINGTISSSEEGLTKSWLGNLGQIWRISGTDNQEKDEKQSQNDKTGLGMEKTVKDKAKSKPEITIVPHSSLQFVLHSGPMFQSRLWIIFTHTSPSFPTTDIFVVENARGPHELKPSILFEPMNEDYYHEQNSCYDYNSFGFDQFQPRNISSYMPIFNSQNELLNSQNKLMEQMATLRELVDQAIQKKEKESENRGERASGKIDLGDSHFATIMTEDNTIANHTVLPIEEPITL